MKLVCIGNTIVDVAVAVGAFPDRGGDVLAHAGGLHAGGAGFNVMAAARRLGVPTLYGGMHGTGPFGDVARAAMMREGVDLAHPPDTEGDTGWDIAITDDTAERTFITVVGAEARLTASHMARVTANAGDAVYLSGYSLLAEPNRTAVCDWLDSIPADVLVVTDPGPLISEIPKTALHKVLAHSTWWSANEREAASMAGDDNPMVAATSIAAIRSASGMGGANGGDGGGFGVVVRLGAAGCLLAESGGEPQHVPGFPVTAVDTNGAGDAHVGAFIASLLEGLNPLASAVRANAAAAVSVTRLGPASAPTTRELEQFLERER